MLPLQSPHTGSSLTPRRLILDLVDADPQTMASSRRLLMAGDIFHFSNNQMRVALSRLVSDGLLENATRGHYRLSSPGNALRAEIQRWRNRESQLVDWDGDWLAVACGNLAAEGSTQFRRQQRALSLRGLQRWRPGIWVRPNNLRGGLAQLLRDLLALELDAIQGSFLIRDADAFCQQELRALWDELALNREYQTRLAQLIAANERLTEPHPSLLAETIEIGSDTVRFLLLDPLLPEGLTHDCQRRALVDAMVTYDRRGRELWQQFIDSLEV